MHALAVGALLGRAGEQIDDLVLRAARGAAAASSTPNEPRAASKSCVDEVTLAKGSIIFCQEAVQFRRWNLSLAGEDLPESDVGLESPRAFPRRDSLEILSIESPHSQSG